MNRTWSIATRIALLLAIGATASTSAFALPHFGFHRHPATPQATDNRITVRIRNDAPIFRDVRIGDRVYTVLSHQYLAITAPPGTEVYAASTGVTYHKGDMLFQMSPALQNSIQTLN